MLKVLRRLVCLFLMACLLCDPALAAGFSPMPRPTRQAETNLCSMAFLPPTIWMPRAFGKMSIPVKQSVGHIARSYALIPWIQNKAGDFGRTAWYRHWVGPWREEFGIPGFIVAMVPPLLFRVVSWKDFKRLLRNTTHPPPSVSTASNSILEKLFIKEGRALGDVSVLIIAVLAVLYPDLFGKVETLWAAALAPLTYLFFRFKIMPWGRYTQWVSNLSTLIRRIPFWMGYRGWPILAGTAALFLTSQYNGPDQIPFLVVLGTGYFTHRAFKNHHPEKSAAAAKDVSVLMYGSIGFAFGFELYPALLLSLAIHPGFNIATSARRFWEHRQQTSQFLRQHFKSTPWRSPRLFLKLSRLVDSLDKLAPNTTVKSTSKPQKGRQLLQIGGYLYDVSGLPVDLSTEWLGNAELITQSGRTLEEWAKQTDWILSEPSRTRIAGYRQGTWNSLPTSTEHLSDAMNYFKGLAKDYESLSRTEKLIYLHFLSVLARARYSDENHEFREITDQRNTMTDALMAALTTQDEFQSVIRDIIQDSGALIIRDRPNETGRLTPEEIRLIESERPFSVRNLEEAQRVAGLYRDLVMTRQRRPYFIVNAAGFSTEQYLKWLQEFRRLSTQYFGNIKFVLLPEGFANSTEATQLVENIFGPELGNTRELTTLPADLTQANAHILAWGVHHLSNVPLSQIMEWLGDLEGASPLKDRRNESTSIERYHDAKERLRRYFDRGGAKVNLVFISAGNFLQLAVVTDEGPVVPPLQILWTQNVETPEAARLDVLRNMTEMFLNEVSAMGLTAAQIGILGVSAGGPVRLPEDPSLGAHVYITNLPGFSVGQVEPGGFPLAHQLQTMLAKRGYPELTVEIMNNAEAALIGENMLDGKGLVKIVHPRESQTPFPGEIGHITAARLSSGGTFTYAYRPNAHQNYPTLELRGGEVPAEFTLGGPFIMKRLIEFLLAELGSLEAVENYIGIESGEAKNILEHTLVIHNTVPGHQSFNNLRPTTIDKAFVEVNRTLFEANDKPLVHQFAEQIAQEFGALLRESVLSPFPKGYEVGIIAGRGIGAAFRALEDPEQPTKIVLFGGFGRNFWKPTSSEQEDTFMQLVRQAAGLDSNDATRLRRSPRSYERDFAAFYPFPLPTRPTLMTRGDLTVTLEKDQVAPVVSFIQTVTLAHVKHPEQVIKVTAKNVTAYFVQNGESRIRILSIAEFPGSQSSHVTIHEQAVTTPQGFTIPSYQHVPGAAFSTRTDVTLTLSGEVHFKESSANGMTQRLLPTVLLILALGSAFMSNPLVAQPKDPLRTLFGNDPGILQTLSAWIPLISDYLGIMVLTSLAIGVWGHGGGSSAGPAYGPVGSSTSSQDLSGFSLARHLRQAA